MNKGVDNSILLWDNKNVMGIPNCPKCGSKQVYYRRILKEFVCRRCGHTWKDEKAVSEEREKKPK